MCVCFVCVCVCASVVVCFVICFLVFVLLFVFLVFVLSFVLFCLHGIYAHARFHDFELDLDFQNVSNAYPPR